MEFEDNNEPYREKMLNPRSRRLKPGHKPKKRKIMKCNDHTPSYMEIKVAALLDELNVRYVMEKTFPDLVSVLFDKQQLPIDFYLTDLKACCEIDGKQHAQKMDDDKYPYSYDRRILNDKTRELFCIKRGYPLLRLKHTHFRHYREIIIEFINKLTDESNKG